VAGVWPQSMSRTGGEFVQAARSFISERSIGEVPVTVAEQSERQYQSCVLAVIHRSRIGCFLREVHVTKR
jgi:hypothetical protein